MDRKLGMELAGFNPLDFFSLEQVEKMRSMKPKGVTKKHRKSKFGKLLDCLDARHIHSMKRKKVHIEEN